MRRRFALLAVLALPALLAAHGLAGCGGGDAEPALAPADAADALTRAPARLRERGPFAFRAEYVETRRAAHEPRGTYASVEGAADLAADEGGAVVDLTRIGAALEELRVPGDASADEGFTALFGRPVELWWDERQAYVHLGGEWRRAPRATLRGAVLGTMAEESVQLVDLLALAEDVRVEGREEVDGEETTHVAFAVGARKAGGRGVPAELHGAFAAGLQGPALALEAWLDRTGLPRRIVYTVERDAIRSRGKVIVPAKTIRVQHDLSRFGDDDLETSPPAEARG